MKLLALIPLILSAQAYTRVPEVITPNKLRTRTIYEIMRGEMISTQNLKKEFLKNKNLNSLKTSSTKIKPQQKVDIKSKPRKQPIIPPMKSIKPITQKIIAQIKKQSKGDSIDLLNNSGNGQLNQIMGQKNVFYGDSNKIMGTENLVVGNNNKILGQVNAAKGDANIVIGSSNTVSGSGNIVKGSNNYVSPGIINVQGFDRSSSKIIGNDKSPLHKHKIFKRNKSKQPQFFSPKPFQLFDLNFRQFDQVFDHPFFSSTSYSTNQWSSKPPF